MSLDADQVMERRRLKRRLTLWRVIGVVAIVAALLAGFGRFDLAGDDYTVADIATFPWVDRFRRHQVDLAEFPNVKRWHEELWERPAVKKGMEVPFYNQ